MNSIRSKELHELEGVSESAASDFLNELTTELGTGEWVTVAGLGTFRKKGEAIEFTPDAVLELEVNAEFAGLKPLLLVKMGTNVLADTDYGYQAEPIEEIGEGIATNLGEKDRERTIPEEKPLLPRHAEPVPVVRNEKKAKENQVPETVKERDQKPAKKSTWVRSAIWSGIAAAVLLIAVAVYFNLPVPETALPAITEPVLVTAPEPAIAAVEPAPQETERPKSDSVLQESTIPEAPKSQETASVFKAGFGAALPADSSLRDFFCIVVHSLDTPEKARKQQFVLAEKGFRTFVQEADVNQKTVFRVGIGQFETVLSAQEAAAQLPEPFSKSFFIKRFSLNP